MHLGASLNPTPWALVGVFAFGVAIVINFLFNCRQKRERREKWNNIGKDVVVLHQFWRGKYCPSLSPFVMKVENFMRFHKIKYESDYTEPLGPRQLCPWITLNGEDISDSQVIIRRLTKHFNLTLDEHISAERKAALDCARIMLEEQLFWAVYLWRYNHDKRERFLSTQIFPSRYTKFMFAYILPRHANKRASAQGMARFTQEEQHQIILNIISNLNDLFGEGPYYGGDKMCTGDCVIFGFLAQAVWNEPGSKYEALIKDEYPKLQSYCLKMKEELYPDWGKLLNPPQQ